MFYLVQAGDVIYVVAAATGQVVQALVMPSGVTIDATKRARFAVINQQVVISNAPSVNVWVDPFDFTVYKLAIAAPSVAMAAAPSGGGVLTGTYLWRYTYAQRLRGRLVNESPLSPAMAAGVAFTANTAALSSITVDATVGTPTNVRRIYRTTTNGADLFFDKEIADNSTTTTTDNNPDAALDITTFDTGIMNAPAGSDGTSQLTLLVAYKGSLFGVGSGADQVDHLVFTENSVPYAWSGFNDIPANPVGEDRYGITGLAPRRDSMLVFKRARTYKLIGSSLSNFDLPVLLQKIGSLSADSVVTINDKTYWLGGDGVYSIDDNDAVANLSRASVDGWFVAKNNRFFDTSLFPSAVGSWNPVSNSYELQIGTQWVAYQIDSGKWFGPHLTGATTPTGRATLRNADGVYLSFVGGNDGCLYLQNATPPDDINVGGTHFAIASDWTLTPMFDGDPGITHYWGKPDLQARVEANGITLTITSKIGYVNVLTSQPAQTMDLTKGRQRLARIGIGALCQLEFSQNQVGGQFLLYGLDVEPVNVVGRR
jgi:hypothetical protein